MRIAISFDYDSPAGLRQSFVPRYIPPDADQRGSDLLMEVLARHGVSATFAVVGNAARHGQAPEHCREQVKRIYAAGHEVASHSMWHRYLPALSTEALYYELAESKAVLEDAIGAPVTGFIPPFNRPTQFLAKGSISISEALGIFGRGRGRQTIPSLVHQARLAGYRWCRVSNYQGLFERTKPGIKDSIRQPYLHDGMVVMPVHITGYAEPSRAKLRQCLAAGVENVLIYSHPNTAVFEGPESAEMLDGLLESFRLEISYGKMQFCTMKDMELAVRNLAPVPAGVSPNSEAFAYPISISTSRTPQETPAVTMPVTIMVPCRNERQGIVKLLDSILAQDMTGLDWEVIVADGMSDDGTRKILDQYHATEPRIRVIENKGLIVSTGLNAAIREARGEVILRMDAHTEYAADYVRSSVETLLRTGAQNVGGPARTRSSGLVQRAIAMAYKNPFACGGARFHIADFEGYVDTVPYGCWRKTTLEALGGFDESLVRNQDDELNLRITRSGGKIWQSPLIQSWYHPRDRIGRLFRQYFQYGFWKVAVIKKHRIPASIRHLVPAAFVLANLVLLVNCVASWLAGWETLGLLGNALWAAMLGAYLLACIIASGRSGAMAGWKILPIMPLIFAVYHCSYGLGFLCGLFYWPFARQGAGTPAKAFTQLSR